MVCSFPASAVIYFFFIFVAGKVYVMYQEDGVKRWLLDHQIKLGLDVTSKPERLPESGLFSGKAP